MPNFASIFSVSSPIDNITMSIECFYRYTLFDQFQWDCFSVSLCQRISICRCKCLGVSSFSCRGFFKMFLTNRWILRHRQYKNDFSYSEVNSFESCGNHILLLQVIGVSAKVRSYATISDINNTMMLLTRQKIHPDIGRIFCTDKPWYHNNGFVIFNVLAHSNYNLYGYSKHQSHIPWDKKEKKMSDCIQKADL